MSEVRAIPFAPGYFVSSDGQVFSSRRSKHLRPMKPWLNNKGYKIVGITYEGVGHRVLVHRLVALVFLGFEASPSLEVRHLDGNQGNCHVSNLAWGTHKENMQDMVRHGTQGASRHPERMARGDRHGSKTKPERVPRGETSGTAKITEDKVRLLRATYDETQNISESARMVGIPRGAAKCVIQGKTWKHVA